MFKEEREESRFEWSMLGDIEEGRANMGSMVHVAVYRLMQFTLRDILIRDFGVEEADRIARRLEAGTVWINEVHIGGPHFAFGGHKQSGIGVENSLHGLAGYTNIQTVMTNKIGTV